MPHEPSRLKKEKFLAVFAATCNLTRSAQATGIAVRTHYDWLKDDPEYPAMYERAKEEAVEAMESIAWDRAQTTSDTLMIFLLKGAKPQKYRENKAIEHTGPGGGPLSIEVRFVDAG